MAVEELKIGELAMRLGLNPRTIRFYEDAGVLPEPDRTAGGYRIYTGEDEERLRNIKAGQRLGFKLGEIKAILACGRRSSSAESSLTRSARDPVGALPWVSQSRTVLRAAPVARAISSSLRPSRSSQSSSGKWCNARFVGVRDFGPSGGVESGRLLDVLVGGVVLGEDRRE